MSVFNEMLILERLRGRAMAPDVICVHISEFAIGIFGLQTMPDQILLAPNVKGGKMSGSVSGRDRQQPARSQSLICFAPHAPNCEPTAAWFQASLFLFADMRGWPCARRWLNGSQFRPAYSAPCASGRIRRSL